MQQEDIIREVVFKKAREEAIAVLKKAEEEANKIIEEAKLTKKKLIEEEKKKISMNLNIDGRIAEAKLRARLVISNTKREILDELEKRIWEYVNKLNQEKRVESLRKILEESLQILHKDLRERENTIIIYVSRRDLENANKVIEEIAGKQGYNIAVREASIMGGAIIEAVSNKIIVDNSYETRLMKILTLESSELRRLFE